MLDVGLRCALACDGAQNRCFAVPLICTFLVCVYMDLIKIVSIFVINVLKGI